MASGSSLTVGFANQRKSFLARGRAWVFYANGQKMVYRTSTDGESWSQAIDVRNGSNAGPLFSTWYDGRYIHYAATHTISETTILYRRGVPACDGTIDWSTSENIAVSKSGTVNYPMIVVDDTGRPWIGYSYDERPWAARAEYDDGRWGTGTTWELIRNWTGNWHVSMVPLPGGRIMATPNIVSNHLCMSYFNGNNILYHYRTDLFPNAYPSTVAKGAGSNDVLVVYLSAHKIYLARADVWESDFVINSLEMIADSDGIPVVSSDPSTGDLYVFWLTENPAALHLLKKVAGAWQPSATLWTAASSEEVLPNSGSEITSFYEAASGHVGVFFVTENTGSSTLRSVFVHTAGR
ncbi:MAG: hypothetical protein JXR83_23210 [Deltaproteobacteria bacterium]|nr:hypothetical protein [Deltaproteobacteria bacterium]